MPVAEPVAALEADIVAEPGPFSLGRLPVVAVVSVAVGPMIGRVCRVEGSL
jgi:hypothetical protein